MRRVTADSNIWVSALIWGGKPLQLLELALQGDIELAVSPPILNETLRVLSQKFLLDDVDLHKAEGFILRCARVVESAGSLHVVQSDPDDNHVIECGVAGDCDTIVSGDLDLLRVGSFQGIKIQTVSEFLAEFQRPA